MAFFFFGILAFILILILTLGLSVLMFVRRLWSGIKDFFKSLSGKTEKKHSYAYSSTDSGNSRVQDDTGSFSPRTLEGQERLRRFKEMSETVMYEETYHR